MTASLVIRGGVVLDGNGGEGRRADVAIDGDRVTFVGDLPADVDADVLDASGCVVAPGFINVLSHAWSAMQRDPTAASDVFQGVTTELFGEAFSPGPAGPALATAMSGWDDFSQTQVFPHLGEGLDALVQDCLAVNVASFIGGHNLRLLGARFDNRPLTDPELRNLQSVVDEEMSDGALGIGTALIYPPGNFANTEELIALSKVVGRHGGTYISHLRSEGDQFLECLDELLLIGQQAQVRTEVYHLKASGRHNWHKMATAIERIEQARQSGRPVSANMYPYTAGGTSLAAAIPPRFHAGGPEELHARLKDPAIRREMVEAISQPSDDFENLYLAAGGGEGVLFFTDFPGVSGKGRRLSEIAAALNLNPAEALLELVARAPGTTAAFFTIDEANVSLGLGQPWVSVGSDAEAIQATPAHLDRATHPRTYGTFARILGHYSRDRSVLTLPEAVRRMTSLPADNFGLRDRGRLMEGAFADVAIFDPATVRDTSTYEQPHSYAVGVRHVVVNGVPVLRDSALTRSTAGRRLRRGV